ncbi:acyl-CoA thioesterase [Catenulispora rubra]|uniref:acyl-CoA thioesterase n=1 Tax=Catenulispora rubra TaxID=280293 RepID=UPI0034DD280D
MDLLELERIEDDLFRGASPDTDVQRVFGGQVLGQALSAATATVEPDRSVHSLHGYFLLPGDPTAPIVYEVDRSRTGRSFSTRRVVARQHGRNIFVMSASYQIPEPGLDHADPRPDAPDPESLSAIPASPADDGEDALWNILYRRWTAFDIRRVPDTGPERRQVWLRTSAPLPDDPHLHTAVLAYVSDLTLLSTTLIRHKLLPHKEVQIASLDHAIWFHRPARADQWLLYDQASPSASGARGLATGRLFTREGTLVATVVQEGLLRVHPAP